MELQETYYRLNKSTRNEIGHNVNHEYTSKAMILILNSKQRKKQIENLQLLQLRTLNQFYALQLNFLLRHLERQ